MRTTDRVRLRAALQIHERLASASERPRALPPLPLDLWQSLLAARHRASLAAERGNEHSLVTTRVAYRDRISQLLSLLQEQLLSFDIAERPGPSQSPAEILADLTALDREFAEFAIDLREKTLSLVTEPIVLEKIELGRFQILLHWQELPETGAYDIIALDPNPATSDASTPHPHVREETLCEGEGRIPIRRALQQGRLLDFGLLVRSILSTYNAGSAYVPLSQWQGTSCHDCGCLAPDAESTSCDCCDSDLCCDCALPCSYCERSCCVDCRDRCHDCEESYCTVCLSDCAGCGSAHCPDCLCESHCKECRVPDETDAEVVTHTITRLEETDHDFAKRPE